MATTYRRTLIVSDGDFTALVSRPLSIAFLAAALLIIALPRLVPLVRGLRDQPA